MSKLNRSYREIEERVISKYWGASEQCVRHELIRISQIEKDAQNLIGKRLLDLGCGSVRTKDKGRIKRFIQSFSNPHEATRFDPWYCRVAHEAGAESVGVDLGSNIQEAFESYQLDLTNPDVLDAFEDESFDGVNNYFLTVPRNSRFAHVGYSPKMYWDIGMQHRRDDWNYCNEQEIPFGERGEVYKQRNHERAWALNDQIREQVERILKEGGAYTLAEFVLRKTDGRLVKDKEMKGIGA